MEEEYGKVKGGAQDWLLLSIKRRSKGLEIYVKVHPEVEAFMASLSEPGRFEDLSAYGSSWEALDGPIKVSPIEKEIMYDGFILGRPCTGLLDNRGNINLSFLGFIGVSEGVRFFISGPFQSDFLTTTLKEKILSASSKFFKQYIVPMNLRLRITSDGVNIP